MLQINSNVHSCHLLFDHFQSALIHGPNIPGSYAILLFIGSDFTSITSHIQYWALFLFWLHLFSISGVISPLISSSILGTYRPREFVFQCPTFLPFHTVHGILKARIPKWFAILFTSGPCFIRTLHHDHHVWPYMAWLIVSWSWTRLWSMWSVWLVFCDYSFHSVCPLMDKDKRLPEASWWERLTEGKTGSCFDGQGYSQ